MSNQGICKNNRLPTYFNIQATVPPDPDSWFHLETKRLTKTGGPVYSSSTSLKQEQCECLYECTRVMFQHPGTSPRTRKISSGFRELNYPGSTGVVSSGGTKQQTYRQGKQKQSSQTGSNLFSRFWKYRGLDMKNDDNGKIRLVRRWSLVEVFSTRKRNDVGSRLGFRHAKSPEDTLAESLSPIESSKSNENIPNEFFFNRLLKTRLSVMPQMDELMYALFNPQMHKFCFFYAVKYLFEFLADKASEFQISDQNILHSWKSNW
ncbi:unnamed protein product [Protopolystoma xenopodis]|uniref:Plexin cytoplasmic RasGAP domain-containing protein n=1 Tax=Protopolystoma xenopodis TaxID=117903 RepID=A0A448WE90_9PLAT|nr:unnamed protein product [Protopolystoma xenopodis]